MGLLFVVVTIVLWPWPYALAVEHFILPEYETTFGFRGGRLPVSIGHTKQSIYALVAVVPDGRLARAGARSGDIPVAHHGGLWAFYGALQEASAGREGDFDVLAHTDWPDWGKHRKIAVAPEGKTTPR